MSATVTEEKYRQWLSAAYRYYIDPDEFGESGMSDYEWDMMSRQLYQQRDAHPEWTAIHHPDFAGVSLFFLRADEYPEWAKTTPQ